MTHLSDKEEGKFSSVMIFKFKKNGMAFAKSRYSKIEGKITWIRFNIALNLLLWKHIDNVTSKLYGSYGKQYVPAEMKEIQNKQIFPKLICLFSFVR